MPYQLKDLIVQEVSIVDEPANKRRFVVVKQAPEAKLREIAVAIDALLASVPEGKLRTTLESVRATIALRLGEAVEGAEPFPSLEHAAEELGDALEGVEDQALKEKLEELADLIDDFLASAPHGGFAGYAYPLPLGKEDESVMVDQTKARAAGYYYGPMPYYGYPYAYPYAYPYGYPKLPKDATEALGKLEAALADMQSAVAGLKALLVSKAEEKGNAGQPATTAEPTSSVAKEGNEGTEEPDLAVAVGEVEKAVQALMEFQKSLLTKEELEEIVRKEVQAALA